MFITPLAIRFVIWHLKKVAISFELIGRTTTLLRRPKMMGNYVFLLWTNYDDLATIWLE